ncbi:antirestriction protein ArdA [Ferrimonas balearica]|uniref:antirestriction protein ArdA n=1 Tax=Ferrimonas balearica TaxID=44012 RepID=UPI001C944646|nr:antirestriction protein ArdA [Ferrimonas balearica]MBY6104995.1 antirestriction protein ArdA [Ferrimonas balearica]
MDTITSTTPNAARVAELAAQYHARPLWNMPRGEDEPAVFVTTYGLYNGGNQFHSFRSGFWISVADYQMNEGEIFQHFCDVESEIDGDEIVDVELMFTDYENFPAAFYGESGCDWDKIEEWGELTEAQREAADHYLDHVDGSCHSRAMEKARDGEISIYEGTRAEYAEHWHDEAGSEIPQWLSGYIDWDAVGRDMECDGFFVELGASELLITR